MTLSRTGEAIEANKSYSVGGWASVSEDVEGPAIYDLMEDYITRKKIITPSGDTSVKVIGM